MIAITWDYYLHFRTVKFTLIERLADELKLGKIVDKIDMADMRQNFTVVNGFGAHRSIFHHINPSIFHFPQFQRPKTFV